LRMDSGILPDIQGAEVELKSPDFAQERVD